jgi:hypothetical protein
MRLRQALFFHGVGRGKAWNRQLLEAVKAIVIERKPNLNLRKLHRITVGFDLDAMLHEHDASLNRSSAFHRPRSQSSHVGSAGCVVGSMRDDRYVSLVFLDASYLADLVDNPQMEGVAANIIAHELAHVALSHWQTQPPSAYVFPTRDPDWRYEVLRFLALNLWDEYAACRLSARFGDPVAVASNFAGCLRCHAVDLPKLRLYSRKHWQTTSAIKTFVQAVATARTPLLSAAYLMGHLDGLGAPVAIVDLCPTAGRSPLRDLWSLLHRELRLLWQRYEPDFTFDMLDGLAPVLMEAIKICGGRRMLVNVLSSADSADDALSCTHDA